MNKLALALAALVLLPALTVHAAETSPADGEPEVTCTTTAPEHVAEGTAMSEDGSAAEEAQRRALATAMERCRSQAEGEPVYLSIESRQVGAVATCTVHFVCSDNC